MEIENDLLLCKRIKITLHLTADEEDRQAIERVLEVYEDACEVASSIKAAIEIESELNLTTK
jgi:uncharacterized OsmC-like protein